MSNKELIVEKVKHINAELAELCDEIEKNDIIYDLELEIIDYVYCCNYSRKDAKLKVELKTVVS